MNIVDFNSRSTKKMQEQNAKANAAVDNLVRLRSARKSIQHLHSAESRAEYGISESQQIELLDQIDRRIEEVNRIVQKNWKDSKQQVNS